MSRRPLALLALAGATVAVVAGAGAAGATGADNVPDWNSGAPVVLTHGIRVVPREQVIAPDGSMFVVSDAVDDHLAGPIVTRIGADGVVDGGFGSGGSIRLAPPNPTYQDVAIGHLDAVLQPASNRLVVAGSRGGVQDWAVMGMSADGMLDPAFGTGGTLMVGTVAGHRASGYDPHLLVTADGSVIAVGYFVSNSFHSLGAIKITPSGQIDGSFGDGGLALVPLPEQPQSFVGHVGGAALDSAGRIVVTALSPSYQWVVARWTPQGAIDDSFSDDGHVMGNNAACGVDVAIDAADRVVMACSASPVHEMRAHAAVVRFQPDGGIDDTFGVDGIAVVPPHSTAGGAGPAVVATVGNSILLGGQITDVALGFNVPSDAAIWRFTPGGQLDRSFGAAGGIVRSDFVEVDNVKSLIPLPDGRLSVLVSGAAESLGPYTAVYRHSPRIVTAEPSFQALDTPERLLDTRIGVGAPVGKVAPGADLALDVIGVGEADVPADAVAVALNVTATATELPGFLTVYPCGTDRPVASNLNFVAGDTIPNLVVAKIGEGGRVCVHSSSPAHVVADLVGYYGARSDLHPLDVPTRKVDTRSGLGVRAAGEKIGGEVLAVLSAGVVNDRPFVSEYVLNVTVTEPVAPGFVTVYQCGAERPVASNLNFQPGQTIANLVVARADHGDFPFGGVCFYASSPTHLVVDVIATLDAGAAHRPLGAPSRLLDTREGVGAPRGLHPAGAVLELDVTSAVGAPDDATAVALNVTVTQPQADGYITVYPCGQAPPLASNLNFKRAQTIPNLVMTKVGSGGRVCLTGVSGTHLVADLAEWYPAVA